MLALVLAGVLIPPLVIGAVVIQRQARANDREALVRLAGEVGLDVDEARDTLETGRFADAVRDDERTAAQLGANAVPFFVVDRAIGAAGAHPPDALLELLNRAWASREPLPVIADGDACGVDGC
jgi:predicted DsbA family dithiol-disulfide isomerase